MERASGWVVDGRVSIAKGIPVGAGLGGGSADAAAALRAGVQAIVAAGGSAPEEDELLTLAREVGADVPFFLRPEPSFAKGVGDVLEPLELPPLPLVLVFHLEQLSTALVYEEHDRLTDGRSGAVTEGTATTGDAHDSATEVPGDSRKGPGISKHGGGLWRRSGTQGGSSLAGSCSAIAGLLENDLERASFRLLPGLREAKDALLGEGVLGAVMSGSGPTLLGVCRTFDEAEESARRLCLRGYQARSARGAIIP